LLATRPVADRLEINAGLIGFVSIGPDRAGSPNITSTGYRPSSLAIVARGDRCRRSAFVV